MDALLPNVQGPVGHHDLQLVEQALIEISALRVEHNVFLVGTTNYAERIDPRILRGGRFSEKIEIGLPDDAAYRALLMRCLGATRLADGLILDGVIERFRGLSPADLQAGVTAAKRAAMRRMREGASELPPMTLADLDEGLRRIR
jgi:transitional endoplasmic reticulum ATPase